MNVRDNLLRSLGDTLPARVDMFEKIEILRRVHRGDRAEPVIAGPQDLAAGGTCTGEQALDPFRLLRIGLRRAARQKGLRVMALLFGCIEGFHAVSLSCVVKLSVPGQSPERLAIRGMSAIFRLPGDADTLVKALRRQVLHVDFQPQIVAAPRLRPCGHFAKQALADTEATETIVDIQILHEDAGPPAPGRKDREEQAKTGKICTRLGDQTVEGGVRTEAETAIVIDRAGELVRHFEPTPHSQDRVMYGVGIPWFACANSDIGR
ncbi:hypothetical protein D9M72_412010 [compost metagenome]